MQKQSIELFADYFQFYLWDEEIAPEAPTDYTEADVARRLKTAPHVVVINPIRNMTVPVTVEIHDAEPLFDADAWDHIAECSLDCHLGSCRCMNARAEVLRGLT